METQPITFTADSHLARFLAEKAERLDAIAIPVTERTDDNGRVWLSGVSEDFRRSAAKGIMAGLDRLALRDDHALAAWHAQLRTKAYGLVYPRSTGF